LSSNPEPQPPLTFPGKNLAKDRGTIA